MSARRRDFWNQQALKLPPDNISTHRDLNQSLLEIEELTKHLCPKENLLVVGCGNGYTTSVLSRYFKTVCAVDYARNFARSPHLEDTYFSVATAEHLPYSNSTFDVAVTKRCLINLPSWNSQKQAIHEIHRVLKKTGTLLMLEATEQGYARLNRMRETVGLSPIKVAWHNKPINTHKLQKEFNSLFHITEHQILDIYYFISRIIHPLLVQPDEPRYDAKINSVARMLEQQFTLPMKASPLTLFKLEKK